MVWQYASCLSSWLVTWWEQPVTSLYSLAYLPVERTFTSLSPQPQLLPTPKLIKAWYTGNKKFPGCFTNWILNMADEVISHPSLNWLKTLCLVFMMDQSEIQHYRCLFSLCSFLELVYVIICLTQKKGLPKEMNPHGLELWNMHYFKFNEESDHC